jgi:hypothetical protein
MFQLGHIIGLVFLASLAIGFRNKLIKCMLFSISSRERSSTPSCPETPPFERQTFIRWAKTDNSGRGI